MSHASEKTLFTFFSSTCPPPLQASYASLGLVPKQPTGKDDDDDIALAVVNLERALYQAGAIDEPSLVWSNSTQAPLTRSEVIKKLKSLTTRVEEKTAKEGKKKKGTLRMSSDSPHKWELVTGTPFPPESLLTNAPATIPQFF